MLIEIFNKNQLKSLYLLGAITVEKANTVETLSAALDLTASSVKRNLVSLYEDLAVLFPDDPVLFEYQGKIMLNKKYNSSRFIPIIKLTNDYLSQSTSANLLKEVIENRTINIVRLSHNLNIAQSYCYTIINNLNNALKKFMVQLQVTNNHVEFVGEEIRLILLTYHFQKWQYELDNNHLQSFLKRNPELAPITTIDQGPVRLKIFTEALLTRGLPKMPSEHYNSDLDELHTLIQEGHDYFSALPKPRSQEGETLKRAVNSIARLWIDGISEEEDQLVLANHMLQLANPITMLAQDLTSSFIYRFKLERFQTNDVAYNILFFQITINLMYIYQFRTDYTRMFYPSSINIFEDEKRDNVNHTVEYTLIDTFIKQVKVDSPIWEIASSPAFKENILRIFYSAYNYNFKLQLKIFVDMSARIDGLYLFKQKLAHALSPNIYTFTTDPMEADIVFIDHGKSIQTSGQVYLLYNVTTTKKWQEVFNYILNIYFEKVDQRMAEGHANYFIESFIKN